MNITKTLEVENRDEWRQWLLNNYQTEKDIWLVFFKKATGKQTVSYGEAVEEALCFGWIDSIQKKIDEEKFVLRFTPRNPKTPYSQTNVERLKKLIKEEKVLKSLNIDFITKKGT